MELFHIPCTTKPLWALGQPKPWDVCKSGSSACGVAWQLRHGSANLNCTGTRWGKLICFEQFSSRGIFHHRHCSCNILCLLSISAILSLCTRDKVLPVVLNTWQWQQQALVADLQILVGCLMVSGAAVSLARALYKYVNYSVIEQLSEENLRATRQIWDLIAATGLVVLFKLDSNRRFSARVNLEIWSMTPKNNGAPLLCYFKLFASFRSHWWIQTAVTVRKRLIWVKIDDFF